jgi:tetratricopeptide (TPR) repeat protein
VSDRLVLDVDADGRATVSVSVEGDLPGVVGDAFAVTWPLDAGALEDLRWYLEEYLLVPYGVYGEKGPDVAEHVRGWGEAVFAAVFGSGAGRDAYVQMREGELVIRSASPAALGLPWELMRDPDRPGPVALDFGAVARALPATQLGKPFAVGAERLRVLMVISRPSGAEDVGYRMVARPLIDRLEAVRGDVDLVVLRPPTLEALQRELLVAREQGRPYQVVHFDGHGVLAGRAAATGMGPPATFAGPAGEGVLVFEKPTGGPDPVRAGSLASVLSAAEVPVVVLNACQSGAVGKELEAAIATRLLQEGTSSVVAMAYTVFAVAAAEFMAAFYERLFAGDTISGAVSAGRRRLAERPDRPSPKGKMPLADWLVPVHYLRRDVHFPGLRQDRPQPVSLDALLDDLRDRSEETGLNALDAIGTFVGRDGLFYDLEVATRHQRVVVLHGPGGTGKTELAKAFGRWWRDTGAVEQPEWIIFHSFEPGIASFGLAGVIDAIGLRIFGTRFASLQPAERRDAVASLLDERRLLLIWDNFESVRSMPDPTGATPALDDAAAAELRAFVARIADGGASSLIITSRTPEPWLGELRRLEVGGLTTDEAIEYADWLLAPHPKAQRKRDVPAFADLLTWLDGHPLSMRLVLPHLATTGPAALLAGLQGTETLPVADGEDAGRTTSLSGSITYSFDHLRPEAQRLLVVLCMFHGVADADVLGMMSSVPEVPAPFGGISSETWNAVLTDAVGVGLLTELGAGMFRLHPALPSYLTARWRQHDPDHEAQLAACAAALLTAYAGLASWLTDQIDNGNAGLAFQVIEAQRRGLGHHLGHALEDGEWEIAQAIVQALDEYFESRGLHEEARGWVDRTRLATESPGGAPPSLDTPAGSLWLNQVGVQADQEVRRGDLDAAERMYLEILEILEAEPESDSTQQRRSVTYHQLGNIAQRRGRRQEAEGWYRRALEIEERLGERADLASTSHQLGSVAHELGRFEEAEQWYHRALSITEELGNLPAFRTSCHQLGTLALDRHQHEAAEDWYRRSLDIAEQIGDRNAIAETSHQLGMLAHARGRFGEAENWYQRSLAIEELLGNQHGIAGTSHQLGLLAQDQDHLDDAERWYRHSLAIKEAMGDLPGAATTYQQLGIVAQLRQRFDEAEQWCRRGFAIEEQLGNAPGMALSLGQLGLLAEARGEPVRGLELLIRCVTSFDTFPHPLMGPAPVHLVRLTAELGRRQLEASWRKVTATAVPDAVLQMIDSMSSGEETAEAP